MHASGVLISKSMETANAGELSATELAWHQKLAAFWSILWPGWLLLGSFLFLVGGAWVRDDPSRRTSSLALPGVIAYLGGQSLFVWRLVRKKYRSFRIRVERADGAVDGQLSTVEALSVAIRIIAPQAMFLAAMWWLTPWLGKHLDTQALRDVESLQLWGRILVVGPYSMSFAVPASYRGFRLQAYGHRLV